MHVHQAVVAHHKTGQLALDFHPGDIFWCTADPGWVTGTSYGIIAPLTNGITSIVNEAEFDAERWYALIQNQKVTIWYPAPTAVRMMMKIGTEAIRKYDLSSLRFIASVGEPLNPEAVIWGQEAFGLFYGMGTALRRAESETDLCLKASSYEMPAWPVDGMDVIACEEAAHRAATEVRAGAGPCFLEFRTYRFRAYSMYDPRLYRSKVEVEEWKKDDPITNFQVRLTAEGILDAAKLKQIEEEIAAEIEKAIAFAEAGTLEPVEELTRFAYSDLKAS